MSTKQDDADAAMGDLYGELLKAFREAKESGLQWLDGEAIAYEALNEAFPGADAEAEREAKNIPL